LHWASLQHATQELYSPVEQRPLAFVSKVEKAMVTAAKAIVAITFFKHSSSVRFVEP
jgi:hypothetical protein